MEKSTDTLIQKKKNSTDTHSLTELFDLPESCIAHVLSFTSPRDVCRLELVSSSFKSVAESDTVWEKFLPSDLDSIFGSSISSMSKKALFFSLCESPTLIDDDKLSFWLEKETGKKCYMLSPKSLDIAWGDNPEHWVWENDPDSRFGEVVQLNAVCWLELRGKIRTSMLSPSTMYKAYLVYKTTVFSRGFDDETVEVNVGINGNDSGKRSVYLDDPDVWKRYIRRPHGRGLVAQTEPIPGYHFPIMTHSSRLNKREDGWFEIEMGSFFNRGDEDAELEMSVLETERGHWKHCLYIQGIEVRAIGVK